MVNGLDFRILRKSPNYAIVRNTISWILMYLELNMIYLLINEIYPMEIGCEVMTPKNIGIKISQSYFSKNCVSFKL